MTARLMFELRRPDRPGSSWSENAKDEDAERTEGFARYRLCFWSRGFSVPARMDLRLRKVDWRVKFIGGRIESSFRPWLPEALFQIHSGSTDEVRTRSKDPQQTGLQSLRRRGHASRHKCP